VELVEECEVYLLIHGDARRLPVDPSSIDAVVTDPPYGMNWDPSTNRFSGGDKDSQYKRGVGVSKDPIIGDDVPFNPEPWIQFDRVVLWGKNHFAHRLPVGTTLIWIKRNEEAFGTFLSDAEIAWMKGGYGVYCFKDLSMTAEATRRVHQNQKPLALMRWCIQKLKLQPNSLILDPYMGSGTTGVAALMEGHRFIGMDLEEKYVRIARKRIERPHAPIARTGKPEHHPLFGESA
jgi:site-specific DNA-methyltransferase (adenine-specific)